MKLYYPKYWKDYELIDSGNEEKLERFGEYILRRPEPQAVWSKSLSEKEWKEMAFARFVQEGSHSGRWDRFKNIPDQWYIKYVYKDMELKFRLGLTGFKHVGIFPEQAVNWNYIYKAVKKINSAKVLNLFAYTGGASLAARAGGADVIHCDSIKNVLNWANHNMQSSRLDNIRWLLEDAFKYVKREARRGNTYHGIILDPPAYGHGPKGEKWKLEDMVNELTEGPDVVAQTFRTRQHIGLTHQVIGDQSGIGPIGPRRGTETISKGFRGSGLHDRKTSPPLRMIDIISPTGIGSIGLGLTDKGH